MAVSNKDLSTLRQVFTSQLEAGASNTYPVYRSPQSKTSYIKKIIVTNNTGTSGTFDIGLYENSFIQGGNVFVAVSSISNVTYAASSTDGITWTARTIPANLGVSYKAGVFGNSQFLLPALSYTNALSSTDGITWTTKTLPDINMGSLNFYNGLFMGTANGNGASSTTLYVSTDAITWTARTLPAKLSGGRVVYGNGTYVVLSSNSNTTTAMYSTDSITWNLTTLPASGVWVTPIYGNGIFFAPGSGGSTTGAYSTDGITWVLRTLPSASNFYGAYGNGTFVLTSNNTTTAYSSTDTITWTVRTMPSALSWMNDLTYGNGVFVAIPSTATNTAAASSPDGITWTLRTMPTATTWLGAIYPQRSDFSNDNYAFKSVTLAANTTQSISYEVIVPPAHEIRVRSTVPMQVTVLGER